jgi:hypothetical protein
MSNLKTIVSTTILVEWSDSPKQEVLLNDMPDFIALPYDEWLRGIEREENSKREENNNDA